MTKVQLKEKTTFECKQTRFDLVSQARAVQDIMKRLVTALEGHDPIQWDVSSRGVLQGAGVELDRLCGVLSERIKIYQLVNALED